MLKVLDDLPQHQKPKLVRGDNAFGHDAMMSALEAREQPYLFKLKLSKNVKRYITSLFGQRDWHDAGQGWEGKDGELILSGWQRACDYIKQSFYNNKHPPTQHLTKYHAN